MAKITLMMTRLFSSRPQKCMKPIKKKSVRLTIRVTRKVINKSAVTKNTTMITERIDSVMQRLNSE